MLSKKLYFLNIYIKQIILLILREITDTHSQFHKQSVSYFIEFPKKKNTEF